MMLKIVLCTLVFTLMSAAQQSDPPNLDQLKQMAVRFAPRK